MSRLLRRLESWWWNKLHPLWDEPDEDVVTPAAFRQWVEGHKHPRECNSGCQCVREATDEPRN